ncbi:hypothetical protein GCM10009548_36530 [Streptomyces malaysiensis subsp. malaysiensis]
MMAELLVRTFTVILLEAVNREVTRLLGQVQGGVARASTQPGWGMVCYWLWMRILGRTLPGIDQDPIHLPRFCPPPRGNPRHPPENRWSHTRVCRYRAPAPGHSVKDMPLYTM